MPRINRWRRDVKRKLPADVVEYGALFVLFSSVMLTERTLSKVVRMLGDISPYYINPRTYGTIVYSVLGIAILAIAGLIYWNHRETDKSLNVENLRFLLAISLLLVGVTYTICRRVEASSNATWLLGTFITAVLGMGGLAVAYLFARDADMRLNSPEEPLGQTIVVITMISVVTITMLVLAVDQRVVNSLLLHRQYIRPLSLVNLVQNTLFTSVFSAFGMGLLYQGAIQETLREYATPTAAIAGTTVSAGCYGWVTEQILSVEGTTSIFLLLAIALLVVFATAFAVRFWRILNISVTNTTLRAAIAVAFGIVLNALFVGGWYSFFDPGEPVFFGYILTNAVIIGTAAVTYERTRSVWLPMFVIGTFYVAINLVAYLRFPFPF